MSDFNAIDALKRKDINEVGGIKDNALTLNPTENSPQNSPAVQTAIDTDVFTANQLYGNNTTPEDFNKIGSGASVFSSVMTPPPTTVDTGTPTSTPAPATSANGTPDIQRTATSSALTGVTDKGNVTAQNDSTQILTNMYEEYARRLKGGETTT